MAKIINQRNSRKKYYQGRGQVVLKMLSRKTRKKKYNSKVFFPNNNSSTLFLDIIYKLQMILFQNVCNIWHNAHIFFNFRKKNCDASDGSIRQQNL